MRELMRWWLLAAVAGCFAVAAGCKKKPEPEPESKVTKANFAKLSKEMGEQDVVAILGDPTEAIEYDPSALEGPGKTARIMGTVEAKKVRHLIWRSGSRAISVYLKDGKVEDLQSSGL